MFLGLTIYCQGRKCRQLGSSQPLPRPHGPVQRLAPGGFDLQIPTHGPTGGIMLDRPTGRPGPLGRRAAGRSDLAKADSESRAMILRSLDSDLTVALLPDLWRWRLG